MGKSFCLVTNDTNTLLAEYGQMIKKKLSKRLSQDSYKSLYYSELLTCLQGNANNGIFAN